MSVRQAEHDEAIKEVSVQSVFAEALEDTKTGGDLERGKVTAILALALIIETVGVKIDRQMDRLIGAITAPGGNHSGD